MQKSKLNFGLATGYTNLANKDLEYVTISQSWRATASAFPTDKIYPIQYQTFLPLPNSWGAKFCLANKVSKLFKLGPSFQRISCFWGNSEKKFLASKNSFLLALSKPITIWFMYLTLLISFIILGKAGPFNSENNDGSISVIGLNLANSTNSSSIFSNGLSEKLWSVATIPFW